MSSDTCLIRINGSLTMIPHVVNVPSTKRGFSAPSQHTLYTSVANEVVSACRKRRAIFLKKKNTQWKKCAVRARPCTVNSGAWATHLALLLDRYPLANVILSDFGHFLSTTLNYLFYSRMRQFDGKKLVGLDSLSNGVGRARWVASLCK